MTDRQRKIMIKKGKSPDKIIQISDKYMNDLQTADITLAEAKAVIERMAHILAESERYRPETLMSNIPLRD